MKANDYVVNMYMLQNCKPLEDSRIHISIITIVALNVILVSWITDTSISIFPMEQQPITDVSATNWDGVLAC